MYLELTLAVFRVSTLVGGVVYREELAERIAPLLEDLCTRAACSLPRVVIRDGAVRVAEVRKARGRALLVLSDHYVDRVDDSTGGWSGGPTWKGHRSAMTRPRWPVRSVWPRNSPTRLGEVSSGLDPGGGSSPRSRGVCRPTLQCPIGSIASVSWFRSSHVSGSRTHPAPSLASFSKHPHRTR